MTTKNELTAELCKKVWLDFVAQHGEEPIMPQDILRFAAPVFFELGKKSTKTTDAPAELITGEELLDKFNSQPSDISSYVTLTEFIERELQKAYELGQKGPRGSVEWLAVAVKAAYQEGHEDGYHTYTDMDWEKSSTKRKLDELLASSPQQPGECCCGETEDSYKLCPLHKPQQTNQGGEE